MVNHLGKSKYSCTGIICDYVLDKSFKLDLLGLRVLSFTAQNYFPQKVVVLFYVSISNVIYASASPPHPYQHSIQSELLIFATLRNGSSHCGYNLHYVCFHVLKNLYFLFNKVDPLFC